MYVMIVEHLILKLHLKCCNNESMYVNDIQLPDNLNVLWIKCFTKNSHVNEKRIIETLNCVENSCKM